MITLYWATKFRQICQEKRLSNFKKLMLFMAFADAEEAAFNLRLEKSDKELEAELEKLKNERLK